MRSLLAAALVLMASSVALRAAEFYPLGTDNPYDYPSAISPDGKVILTSHHLWTVNDGFSELNLATTEVWTRGISNNGLIAGLWCGSNTGSCYEGFVATAAGPGEGLGAFNDQASDAFAISADGSVVVGNSSSESGTSSFRWTAAMGMVEIEGLAPAAYSHNTAFGVSADGSVVVGQSGDDTVLEAYRWTAATGSIGLGDLPGGASYSTARGISADGNVIVGQGMSAVGSEAFRWTEATGMIALGAAVDGDAYNIAYAATADGAMVVGEHERDAFLWTDARGLRKLQDVLVDDFGLGSELDGWRLAGAGDISDDGRVIIGYGFNPAQELEGFVVTVPEPSAMTLLMIAIVLLLLDRCRQHFQNSTCRKGIVLATSAIFASVVLNATAKAQLTLSNSQPLRTPGFTFSSVDGEEARVTGAAIDPVSGHLWVSGEAEPLDEESEDLPRPGLAEIDLATGQVLFTISRSVNLDLDYAASLAIHPHTRNLWVSWLHVVDERPNISGAMELTQAGEIEALVRISQTGELLEHIGEWDPALFGPQPGLEVYLPSAAFSPSGELFWVSGGGPAFRFDSDSLQVTEQLMFSGGPNTNYASGAFDPFTGNWFVATTNNSVLEIDPISFEVLSETDLKPYLPSQAPIFGQDVQAFEFSKTGNQVILGGSFGLVTIQRAVPEPTSCGLVLVAGIGCGLMIRFRGRYLPVDRFVDR